MEKTSAGGQQITPGLVSSYEGTYVVDQDRRFSMQANCYADDEKNDQLIRKNGESGELMGSHQFPIFLILVSESVNKAADRKSPPRLKKPVHSRGPVSPIFASLKQGANKAGS